MNVVGWAIDKGKAATVSIRCNDVEVTQVETSVHRPDVNAALGSTGDVGFAYRFPRSIQASDVLSFGIVGTEFVFQAGPHLARRDRLACGVEPGRPGLEIGALDRPFLNRPAFDVVFVDHATRDDLQRKYKGTGSHDTIDVDGIVETDIVWVPGRRLSECASGRRFDYAVASQAMEHVADPIGWLNDIADCLNPGGRINLSLPDMRRTFDHARRLSTAADMIEAFERRWDRPRFRAVFDHIANVSIGADLPAHDPAALQQAYEVAQIAERGEYVDVHCHVWTSDSFQDCWSIIDKLHICKARLDQIWAPAFSSNEFIVSFTT